MKAVFQIFVVLFLLGIAVELTRIHSHLHVIECSLTGRITDSDGVSTWRQGKDCKEAPGKSVN